MFHTPYIQVPRDQPAPIVPTQSKSMIDFITAENRWLPADDTDGLSMFDEITDEEIGEFNREFSDLIDFTEQ
jgi:hypothetical protein